MIDVVAVAGDGDEVNEEDNVVGGLQFVHIVVSTLKLKDN
jgi:hypothetical protein